MVDSADLLADLLVGLTFYCNAREDGGVRVGVSLGPITVHEIFRIDGDEYDPSLVWSIELRCEGETLPTEPHEVDPWLQARSTVIKAALSAYAEELRRVSERSGEYPLRWLTFPGLPASESMEFFCTAQRRVDAGFLATQLESLGKHWDEILNSLQNPLAGLGRG